MKYHPKNTLAYLLKHPSLVPLDMTNAPVEKVAKQVKLFKEQTAMTRPEAGALTLYCYNHLIGMLRRKYGPYDPLPPWAVELVTEYTDWLQTEARRSFSYLLLICTRESRHMPHPEEVIPTLAEFGPEVQDFFQKIKGMDELSAIEYLMDTPPSTTMGRYVAALSKVFYDKHWGTGHMAFGGPKWGAVADCLLRAIKGETSLEVMVDTSYTLAHNGGPIFNKGMLYKHHNNVLTLVLDVQRSGQIPSLIKSGMVDKEDFTLPAYLKTAIANVDAHIEPISKWVDWNAVEDLGAVGNYAKVKKQQAELMKAEGITEYPVIQFMPDTYAAVLPRNALTKKPKAPKGKAYTIK